jgi:membrane peptidoglycan carboxypeptidase
MRRIALMAVVDPQSTAFERSEAWRVLNDQGRLPWRQQWVSYADISDNLKRAVIASEDDVISSTTTVWTGRPLRRPGRKHAKRRGAGQANSGCRVSQTVPRSCPNHRK